MKSGTLCSSSLSWCVMMMMPISAPPISAMLWLAKRTASTFEARIGFVENRELRPEHGHLQDLGPLHFTAGKPFIDVAASELRIHAKLFHLALQFLAELTHWDQLFAFFAFRRRTWSSHGGGSRPASRRGSTSAVGSQEDAAASPFVGFEIEHVISRAVDRQLSGTVGDFVARVAGNGVTERTLAGAVGAHERVSFRHDEP